MRRSFVNIFIFVSTFTFLLPLQGRANCNLENSLISLKLIDKPVRDILKSVEQQTEFSFDIRDDSSLNEKKSIVLNDIPLDQSLRRLLKNINYSVICNNEKKILTLVFFDSSRSPSSVVARSRSAQPSRPADMSGIASALEQYNSKEDLQPLQDQKETSMDPAVTAFKEYNTNPLYTEPQNQKETSMDPAVASFAEYKNNKNNPQQTEPQYKEETSMDATVDAFKEYKSKRSSPPSPQQEQSHQNETSMDGVIAAFEEYNKVNK